MIWAKIISGALKLANLIGGWLERRSLKRVGRTEQQRDDMWQVLDDVRLSKEVRARVQHASDIERDKLREQWSRRRP